MGGYLFLCCAMYSSKRFRANKRATNQSCRFHMSITSSLSEGEKTCSLRSWKEATAGRQCRAPAEPAECDAFCLASVAAKQNLFRCSVFPRSQKAVTPILYTACGGLSRNFKKGLDNPPKICYDKKERGVSAVGSAQHWQCWGQGFESPTLHQRAVPAPNCSTFCAAARFRVPRWFRCCRCFTFHRWAKPGSRKKDSMLP